MAIASFKSSWQPDLSFLYFRWNRGPLRISVTFIRINPHCKGQHSITHHLRRRRPRATKMIAAVTSRRTRWSRKGYGLGYEHVPCKSYDLGPSRPKPQTCTAATRSSQFVKKLYHVAAKLFNGMNDPSWSQISPVHTLSLYTASFDRTVIS